MISKETFRPVSSSPVVLAAIGSLLLTLIGWYGGIGINNDAVLYLQVADVFRKEGFSAATELYGWPFYSMLIAWLSQAGLSLINAAHLLNAMSFALLSGSFVAVVGKLHPLRQDVKYVAIAVILLLPELTELRHEFLRDNWYFALVLLSLYMLLCFVEKATLPRLLLWVATVALASLFRIEAMLIGFAGAFALLAIRERRAWGGGLALLVLLGGAVSLLLLRHYFPDTRVRDVEAWWNFYATEVGTSFVNAADRLEVSVLNEYSKNYAKESMVAVLAVLLAGKVFKGLTIVHALLIWMARKDGYGLSRAGRWALVGYGVGAVLPALLFVVQYYFLTQRYVFAFILILLLLAPYSICAALERVNRPRLRWAVALLLACVFVGATARKLVGQDELLMAGQWLVGQTETVWTNSAVVGLYADPEFQGRHVEVDGQAGWIDRLPQPEPHNWVVVAGGDDEQAASAAVLSGRGMHIVKRFEGRRKAVVVWGA